nr:hypothetical protein [Tanacetum cinerariifolium]
MVNIGTDADLSAAVQNALQALLPQILAEIREEFRTSSGPSDAGGNPPPISYMEKIFDVMGCEDAFKTRLAVYKFEGNALAWWKAYKQAKGGDAWLITVTWADFKKLFFLQFFLRAEQSDHGHNNDRHRLDRRGGNDNHRSSNNNYSGSNNRNSGYGRDQRNRGQQSNRSTNSGSQQSRGPSEGYSYPVCTTCGRRHPEECRRAAVLASSMVKLAIYRRIARRTPLQAHLVRLIRSQVLRVVFSPSLKVMLLILQVPSRVHYLFMDMQCLCYLIRVLHILLYLPLLLHALPRHPLC